ncbi:MAG: hypothetical protein Q4C46_07680 [Bacillota bacterium]|nr:hypothetical protein [Bacillota bacterium]
MVKGSDDDAIYTNEKDEYCPSKDMTFVAVYEEPVTLEVPFTTTVKQGGNVAPGKTVFTLELVDFQGKNLSSKDVIVTAAVTTNGVGSYDGTMTIKGTSEGIARMFTGPVFVKQADIDDPNWTVDGKVWGLVYKEAVALSTDDEIIPSPMAIFPATLITSENGSYYEIPDGAYEVKELTFTNTYTKSVAEPSGNEGTTNGDSKNDADTNPKTGDDSNLTLWLTLLALSAAGAGGTCVYSRRRRSSRAK